MKRTNLLFDARTEQIELVSEIQASILAHSCIYR